MPVRTLRSPLPRAAVAAALLGALASIEAAAAPQAEPASTPIAAGPSAAVQPLAGQSIVTVTTETGTLRRLPSIGRSTKLTGENDHLTWPVWLTAAEAASAPRLRLTHVAAVSVMPEGSRLTVFVDGKSVGSFPIATNGGAKTVELTLPAGTLHAGWNDLRVEAEQRHRVECSAASTYELWTEIDRARTGLVFPQTFAPERRNLADVADVAPDASGRVRIRLVTATDPDPVRLARALRLAQAVSLAGGFLDPVVSVVRAPEKGPGIDLLIGAQARAGLGATAALPADVVALIDDPDPTRLTLAVPEDATAIDRVVADFTAAADHPEGSPAGLRARAALGGLPIAGGEGRTLAELGATSTEFSGRLFRTAVDLRLPADLYAADYAKVSLKLAGGYAPGLDRASRLTLRVNGRQIAGMPLSNKAGEIFSDRALKIPLSAFRPGRNRLEIEASVPHGDDATCDPALQIDAAKRFLFVDRSEIVFPTFARIAHLPDLGATSAGVFASLDAETRPTVWMPRPDRGTVSALATLLTRIATADGRVGVPEIAYRNPPADAPSAWVVGAFADLPGTIAGAVGIEPVAIRDAWSRRPAADRVSEAAPAATDPLARRVDALRLAALEEAFDPIVTGTLQFRPTATADGKTDLVDQWRRSMESPWSPAAFVRGAESQIRRALGPVLGDEPKGPAFAPTPTTGVVFAQALSGGGGVWTLTTAATATALAEGVEILTEAERWGEISGKAAAWDRVDEKLQTAPTDARAFFPTTAPNPGNFRLIAAGWVGEHPIVFVAFALLAAGLLGFSTARLIPHVGVRS